MKIRLKHSINIILNFLFLYTLFIQGLMSLLHLPQFMLYIKDFVLLTAILLSIICKGNKIENQLSFDRFLVIVLIAYCVFNGILYKMGISTILVGARKMFRGFFYFYLCVQYLSLKDFERNMRMCYKIEIFNLILICFQFFFLHIGQDHCNGIFGTGLANNFNSLLCAIVICYSTYEYASGKCKLEKFLVNFFVSMIITVVAELKILFFVLPFIIIVAFQKKIFSRKFIKILLITLLSGVAFLIIFSRISTQLYSIISISGLKYYIEMNEIKKWGQIGISRVNWMSFTQDNVFHNDFSKKMFGVGFGNISGIIYNSIISQYTIWGYGGYVLSTVYLETGLLGLSLLWIWFANQIINLKRHVRVKENSNIKNYTLSLLIIALIYLDYSNFLFNDSTFIFFYGLSYIHIFAREEARLANRCFIKNKNNINCVDSQMYSYVKLETTTGGYGNAKSKYSNC